MKEIKFRYYWLNDWHYIDFNKDNLHIKFEVWEIRKTSKFYQYTGLKDKNGQEIYNGDIIKSNLSGIIYKIEWKEEYAQFIGHSLHSYYCPSTWKNGEVIGNIYENPELINNGKT